MDTTEIGNRIKICRKQRNLTQEELAERIDVSSHYIYEIERGTKTMSLSILTKLSVELNISADYILFGSHAIDNVCKDQLHILIESVPARNRDNLANIIKAILPHMK